MKTLASPKHPAHRSGKIVAPRRRCAPADVGTCMGRQSPGIDQSRPHRRAFSDDDEKRGRHETTDRQRDRPRGCWPRRACVFRLGIGRRKAGVRRSDRTCPARASPLSLARRIAYDRGERGDGAEEQREDPEAAQGRKRGVGDHHVVSSLARDHAMIPAGARVELDAQPARRLHGNARRSRRWFRQPSTPLSSPLARPPRSLEEAVPVAGPSSELNAT